MTPAAPLAGLFGASTEFSKRFFPISDPLEEIFDKLSTALALQNKRYLVIIDDIDRLNPDEAVAIFRLVKSIGRLPNVMYLLVFDRVLGEAAVSSRYPSEGPQYLEKIVQASFEIPMPLQADINSAALAVIADTCGDIEDDHAVHFMNIFYDVVAPYLSTPRHVTRLQNAISVTWPPIANEVNMADFLAIETFRIYEPGLYHAIRKKRSALIGTGSRTREDSNKEQLLNTLVSSVHVDRQQQAKIGLERLFPALESTSYGSEFIRDWDAERRVCVESHFDTVFRLSLSDETLSVHQIDNLVARADERQFIRDMFMEAAQKKRRNGASLVPVILDAATVNARRFERHKLIPFLTELFAVYDQINLPRDDERGMMAFATTPNRVRWFINKAVTDQFDLEERSAIFEHALSESSTGWLVRFTSWARRQDGRDDGKLRPEPERLVKSDVVDVLTHNALSAIRHAASSGVLIEHHDLLHILYRWSEFLDGDATEVRSWTNSQIDSARGLLMLAKAFTGESWVHGGGFSGLGDRVSRRYDTSSLNDNERIIDSNLFIQKLETARSQDKFEGADLATVSTFLEAHKNRNVDRF